MTSVDPDPGALVEMTETSWRPVGDMDWEQYAAAGRELQRIGRCWAWHLGDWLVHGQRYWPSRYEQAIVRTGLEWKTLQNIASVARQVRPEVRHAGLAFSHHAEVAALAAEDQRYWLTRAYDEGMTKERLRAALKAKRRVVAQRPSRVSIARRREEARELSAEGLSQSQVAERLGVHQTTVSDDLAADVVRPFQLTCELRWHGDGDADRVRDEVLAAARAVGMDVWELRMGPVRRAD